MTLISHANHLAVRIQSAGTNVGGDVAQIWTSCKTVKDMYHSEPKDDVRGLECPPKAVERHLEPIPIKGVHRCQVESNVFDPMHDPVFVQLLVWLWPRKIIIRADGKLADIGTDIATIGKHVESNAAYATGLEGDGLVEGWKEKVTKCVGLSTGQVGIMNVNILRGHTVRLKLSISAGDSSSTISRIISGGTGPPGLEAGTGW